ncbi:MAG TPA: YkgJ family cysteine cluster protein [Desulfatirhabdiaceae bacterium]|nr:YkgJ family cysteine cluster protein [Desulfatirhabdiaceae bacterium]
MKYIDLENQKDLNQPTLNENSLFSFRCHPGISCFNHCCHHLNLFLYPYDVIRLKNRLGIPSNEFLDRHVDVVIREGSFFPDVLLTMSEAVNHPCPFLTETGCGVYEDRPDACRMFPLEQGMMYDTASRTSRQVYFFRPPEFCMGRHENNTWSPRSWIQDQCAKMHNDMTILWSGVLRLFQENPWGNEGPEGPKAKMAFMTAYNIDEFRKIIFNSSFLKRYKIPSSALNRARTDDAELLHIGFAWIKRFLWDISTPLIQPRR